MDMTVKTGDRVTMKKTHACGNDEFVVTRTGADYKLTCLKCGRTLLLPSEKAMKAIKRVIPEKTV